MFRDTEGETEHKTEINEKKGKEKTRQEIKKLSGTGNLQTEG